MFIRKSRTLSDIYSSDAFNSTFTSLCAGVGHQSRRFSPKAPATIPLCCNCCGIFTARSIIEDSGRPEPILSFIYYITAQALKLSPHQAPLGSPPFFSARERQKEKKAWLEPGAKRQRRRTKRPVRQHPPARPRLSKPSGRDQSDKTRRQNAKEKGAP